MYTKRAKTCLQRGLKHVRIKWIYQKGYHCVLFIMRSFNINEDTLWLSHLEEGLTIVRFCLFMSTVLLTINNKNKPRFVQKTFLRYLEDIMHY